MSPTLLFDWLEIYAFRYPICHLQQSMNRRANKSRDWNRSSWLPPKGFVYSSRGIPSGCSCLFGMEKCLPTNITGSPYSHYCWKRLKGKTITTKTANQTKASKHKKLVQQHSRKNNFLHMIWYESQIKD